MGYIHIDNFYKLTWFFKQFQEVYALEKIHGTSARIHYSTKQDKILFHSGGEKHDNFIQLFDSETLENKICNWCSLHDVQCIYIFGEAYGGRQQGMSKIYGPDLKFIVFDVKIDDTFLNVADAHTLATDLGLEFVHYERGPCTVEWLNQQRDRPSVQAERNGMGNDKVREGIVVRPLQESQYRGKRAIGKHKAKKYSETHTYRDLGQEIKIQEDIDEIVADWLTKERLQHVIDKILAAKEKKFLIKADIGKITRAMEEDIKREAAGEIIWSDQLGETIRKETAALVVATFFKDEF